ncbi:YggT family protein [Tistrella mobilis]|jgi:YggT family protein|uniref:YggT family protein n=1 Tax=Tistrella mobilis TaxID=171437 RepID=UPI00355853A8
MVSLLQGLLFLFNAAIEIYTWILIASVILSWLVAFNVVNTNNQVVYAIGSFIHRITEPVLRPIRNVLPSLGGLDLSPLILLLLLNFLKIVVNGWLAPYAYGMMY